jgi:hypothetical protein
MNIIERYQLLNNGKIILPPAETSKRVKKIFIWAHGETITPIQEWEVPNGVRIFIYIPVGVNLMVTNSDIPLFCRSDNFIKNNVYRIYNPGSKIYDMNIDTKTPLDKMVPFKMVCDVGQSSIIPDYLSQFISLSQIIEYYKNTHFFMDFHFMSCRSYDNETRIEELLERTGTLNLHNLPWTEEQERENRMLPDEIDKSRREMLYTGPSDFEPTLPEPRRKLTKKERRKFKLTKKEKRRIGVSKITNSELINQRTKRNELFERFRNPKPMVFPETFPFQYNGTLEYRNPFGKNNFFRDITYLRSL